MLRPARYENALGIADNPTLPTSVTGVAVRKQAPVLVIMMRVSHAAPINSTYDGYASCPLVTDYGKLVLAGFDYSKKPDESFPPDRTQERYSMYALKAYGRPAWTGTGC